jgi:hypothetical protein
MRVDGKFGGRKSGAKSAENLAAAPFGEGVLPGAPKTLRILGWLPETVNRVETHVSHRKQKTGYPSTRNVPAHAKLRFSFASWRGVAHAHR